GGLQPFALGLQLLALGLQGLVVAEADKSNVKTLFFPPLDLGFSTCMWHFSDSSQVPLVRPDHHLRLIGYHGLPPPIRRAEYIRGTASWFLWLRCTSAGFPTGGKDPFCLL